TAKIRAAVAARRDDDFVIVARTDVRSIDGFDATLARSLAYLGAGADMIFPEALESAEEYARFAEAIQSPKLANMTEFGRSPLLSFDELVDLGYQAVLYPLTAFRAAMRAVEQTLTGLRDQGSQSEFLDRMQSRGELYDLLGYHDWEARDRS